MYRGRGWAAVCDGTAWGSLNALKPKTPAVPAKPFKAYAPGFVHVDVKYLPQTADQMRRSYLFVAIGRATRWVFVAVKPNKSAAAVLKWQ
jgi:hypothetical protein